MGLRGGGRKVITRLVIELEIDDIEMLLEIGQSLPMSANCLDQIIRHSIRDRWLAIKQGYGESTSLEKKSGD